MVGKFRLILTLNKKLFAFHLQVFKPVAEKFGVHFDCEIARR